MYSQNGYFKYQQNDVFSLSEMEIVDRLLKALCSSIDMAAAAMEQGDIAQKGKMISRAVGIAGELQAALNLKEGGEIAENLFALYDYIIRELVCANIKGDINKLKTAEKIVRPILEAWSEIMDSDRRRLGMDPVGESETQSTKQLHVAF